MWEIGFVIGGIVGLITGATLKRNQVIKTAPEVDLIAEIKRRRVEARFKQEAENNAMKDLEGL